MYARHTHSRGVSIGSNTQVRRNVAHIQFIYNVYFTCGTLYTASLRSKTPSLTLIRALLSSPPPHTHTNTHRHIQPHTQTPVHPYTHAYIYTHTLYLSALHDLPRSHLRSFQLSPTHTCPLPTLALNPAPLKPALYSHLPLTLPFSHLPSPHLPCPASLTPALCALWLARRLRQRGYTHTPIRIYKHTLSLSFRHTLTLPRSR